MYKVFHRQLALPYSNETITLIYYRCSDAWWLQTISPFRDDKHEPLGYRANNQQEEVHYALGKKMNYDDQGKSVVYEDANYMFGISELIKDNIMFHLDDLDSGHDFHSDDNYFTSRDMLLKVTHVHNWVHFWHVKNNKKDGNFDSVL